MIKERLRRYRELKREAKQIHNKLEEIESRLYSPRGQLLTGLPSAPSPGGGTVTELLIERHAQLVQQYQEQLAKLEAEQLAVEQAIASLEDSTARQLLRYRYIDGLKWEEVCVRIKYSWTQTHEIHGQALQQLREQEKPEV